MCFGFEVLGSCFGATSDTDDGSVGSALHTSGTVFFGAAGLALLKSSLPEGFGFGGSSLTPSLASFGSDLTMGFVSVFVEAALERPGSLVLEVEAAVEDFMFAEDRAGRISVRFCETTLELSREGRGCRGFRTLTCGPVIRPNATEELAPLLFPAPASRRAFAGSHKRAGS